MSFSISIGISCLEVYFRISVNMIALSFHPYFYGLFFLLFQPICMLVFKVLSFGSSILLSHVYLI